MRAQSTDRSSCTLTVRVVEASERLIDCLDALVEPRVQVGAAEGTAGQALQLLPERQRLDVLAAVDIKRDAERGK